MTNQQTIYPPLSGKKSAAESRFKPRALLILLTLFISFSLQAQTLPQANSVPGGIAIVELGPLATKPSASYKNKKVLVLKRDKSWFAIIGIALSSKAGKHFVSMKDAKGERKKSFMVTAKTYQEQRITLSNNRMVNPNKMDMTRIKSERSRITNALKYWQDQVDVNVRFALPVDGRFSSPFGLRRFFNEQPRKPHSGLDIAAPTGTPIKAPSPGTVIETGHFFFNGNTVFLLHGQGLVTMYCHMNKINVQPGDSVKTGDILGTVGMTGRVTGPHLHWSVSLNNARVDPNLFIASKSPE